MNIPSIVNVEILRDYQLKITFNDGLQKLVDIMPFIGSGVSSQLKDPEYFKNVIINDGYICWENGFDFCPQFLYRYTPKS